MSPSPLDNEVPEEGGEDLYADGWRALNKLLRRGYSWSGRERNAVFLNIDRGREFADASRVSGLDFSDDGRALAVCDWDFDGDEDLLLTSRSGPRLRFLENRVHARPRRFALRPEDEVGGALIGARVEVRVGERWIVRTLRAGEGYLAQSSRWLHFPAPGEARVVWPGEVEPEVFRIEAQEGFYALRRGSGEARKVEVEPVALPGLAPAPLSGAAGGGTRVVLSAPVPLPRMELSSSNGAKLELFGIAPGGEARGTGKPILLHLFASWCAPCVRELGQLSREKEALESSGMAFLALSVETEPEERESARALMERLEWPFAWGFTGRETAEILDALAGTLLDREERLALPASFLVDASGQLRAVYFGPVSAAELARDRRLLQATPEKLLEAATPFPGRWYERPSGTSSLEWLEARMRSRGLDSVGKEYGRGAIQIAQSSPANVIHGFGRRAAAEGDLRRAMDYFLQAIEEDPAHFDSHFDIALLLHRAGRLPEAAQAYAKALRLRPDDVDTHFNLGLVYVGLSDLEAAESERRWLAQRDERLASLLQERIAESRAR